MKAGAEEGGGLEEEQEEDVALLEEEEVEDAEGMTRDEAEEDSMEDGEEEAEGEMKEEEEITRDEAEEESMEDGGEEDEDADSGGGWPEANGDDIKEEDEVLIVDDADADQPSEAETRARNSLDGHEEVDVDEDDNAEEKRFAHEKTKENGREEDEEIVVDDEEEEEAVMDNASASPDDDQEEIVVDEESQDRSTEGDERGPAAGDEGASAEEIAVGREGRGFLEIPTQEDAKWPGRRREVNGGLARPRTEEVGKKRQQREEAEDGERASSKRRRRNSEAEGARDRSEGEEEEEEEPQRRSLRPRKRNRASEEGSLPPQRKALKREPGAGPEPPRERLTLFESLPISLPIGAGLSGREQHGRRAPTAWCECADAACRGRRPVCVSLADQRCALSSHTAAWHHLSPGEHFCSNCFAGLHERLTSADNQLDFDRWVEGWNERLQNSEESGDVQASILHYMAYNKLPFWVRCYKCQRWRQIPRSMESRCLDVTWLARFCCALLAPRLGEIACNRLEDERVSVAKGESFTKNISYQPLLQTSPVCGFLTEYAPHAVGINVNPVDNSVQKIIDEDVLLRGPDLIKFPKPEGVPAYLHPFRQPGSPAIAMDLPPDDILHEEVFECEELTSHKNLQALYLGVRNLILGLWSMNVKEWLTPETVAQHLWIRGLVRVRLVDRLVPHMIGYFTERGLINFGLLPDLPSSLQRHLLLPAPRRFSCVVVGAGLTGLVAARQLRTLGCDVTVLEGSSRVGGRIRNIAVPRKIATRRNGQTIRLPLGAHIVHGCVNNPLSVVAHQAELRLVPVPESAVLFSADHNGVVPLSIEERAEFHFLAVCERIRYLRDRLMDNSASTELEDKSFGETYRKESQAAMRKLSDMTQEHQKVLRFFEADLECANGANLEDLSWLYWDANEYSSQFAGAAVLLSDAAGLETVTQHMARGLNVRTSRHVTSIEEDTSAGVSGLVVKTTNGEAFRCDRVIMTVPFPTLLRDEKIRLTADEALAHAARRLGCGKKEKVLLLFRQRFWERALREANMEGAHFIGRVPEGKADRGFCHLFQDLDPQNREVAALETQLFGEALETWRKRPHEELVAAITMVLRSIFPKVAPSVLEPIWSHMTSWSDDETVSSTCIYRAVGSRQSDYDHLSKPLMNNRLFCIGEGTYTHFPQTVTGAFLSGLSGAFRITAS